MYFEELKIVLYIYYVSYIVNLCTSNNKYNIVMFSTLINILLYFNCIDFIIQYLNTHITYTKHADVIICIFIYPFILKNIFETIVNIIMNATVLNLHESQNILETDQNRIFVVYYLKNSADKKMFCAGLFNARDFGTAVCNAMSHIIQNHKNINFGEKNIHICVSEVTVQSKYDIYYYICKKYTNHLAENKNIFICRKINVAEIKTYTEYELSEIINETFGVTDNFCNDDQNTVEQYGDNDFFTSENTEEQTFNISNVENESKNTFTRQFNIFYPLNGKMTYGIKVTGYTPLLAAKNSILYICNIYNKIGIESINKPIIFYIEETIDGLNIKHWFVGKKKHIRPLNFFLETEKEPITYKYSYIVRSIENKNDNERIIYM